MIVHTSPAAGDAQALDLKENKIQLGSKQKAHGRASTKMSIQEETETSCSHISVDKDVASPKSSKPSRVKRLSKRLSAYLSFIQLSDSEEVVGVVDSTSNGEKSSIQSPSKESKSRLLFGLFKGPRSRAMSDSDSLSRKTKDSKPMEKRISLGLDLSSPNSHETEAVTVHSAIRRVSSMPISSFPSAVSPTAYGQNHLYEKLEQLGEGSYATVFKGKSKVNDMFVALKEIRLQEEEGAPFTAIREASLLKQLKHANIVRLHDIIHTNSNLTLVFEYLHTDLCQYLERHPNGINDYNAKIFLFQLLRGLSYIHKRRILHRDLKPQNLLLSEMGDLKLADFGLARSKTVPSRTYSNEVVTLWYRPPDVLCGSKTYSTSLDVWGVGCIFLEMLTGFPLFPGTKGVIDQLEKIWKICGSPDQEWYSKSKYNSFEFAEYLPQQLGLVIPRLTEMFGAEDIAVKMIQCYPEKRITCEQALRHHYFSDLPKEVYVLPDTTSIISVKGVALQLEANSQTHQDPSRNGPRENSSSGGRFFV